MGAVLLSPLYLLLNLYLAARLLLWFSTLHSVLGSLWFKIPFLICYVLVALTPLTAAVAGGKWKARSKRISNYWLGALMYLLIFLLLADLIRIIYWLLHDQSVFTPFPSDVYRITGTVTILVPLLLSLYGIRHASHIKKTHYDVEIAKDCPLPSLKIALLADLHLGYSVGCRHLQKIKKVVESIQPDLIVYAGDIFDNEFDAIDRPDKAAAILSSISSACGSYACWGNHDIEEMILAGFTFRHGKDGVSSDPRMEQFQKDAGITLLEDETVLISDSIYLCGRLDVSCPEKSGRPRLSPDRLISGLDRKKPVLVMDHQPSQLDELAEAGADLVLSGHTHNGQLFPGNLVGRIGWKNPCGKYCHKNMTSIVTSGAGIWGPAMRIGTDSEVVEITVKFTKNNLSKKYRSSDCTNFI